MPARDFINEMNAKQISSIGAVNRFIRQGCEFEAPISNALITLKNNLQNIGAGLASSKGINDGNGWNNDVHNDGGSCDWNGIHYTACETSTSPFHAFDYNGIRGEFDRILKSYLDASGGIRHVYSASTHVHTAIAYNEFGGDSVCMVQLPVMKMYRNVAMFLTRFLPVMKWVSMTNVNGARGAHGNTYDMLQADMLYAWYDDVALNYRQGAGVVGHTEATDYYMVYMQRGSCFRIPLGNNFWNNRSGERLTDRDRNLDIRLTHAFHFENRMMDCNFSGTMMAAWFCLQRAIALWSYDMARNNHQFMPTQAEITASKHQAENHRAGWKSVDKAYIVGEWALMKSYLTKYFKLANSLDALDTLDKLIDCPIPMYLEQNDIRNHYDLTVLEKHFAVRVREKDDTLRDKYLDGIKKMLIPHAPSLNDFHTHVALYLGVQQKQAVSLYQMLKRENVDLEFMAGRLVHME